MKNTTKRLIAILLTAVCIIGLVACGKKEAGEIPETAVSREAGTDDGVIYIDDEAIALAETASAKDPAVVAAEQQVLTLVNQQRAAAGLSALTWSNGLADAAAVRAQEAMTSWSHTRPDGSDWWTVNSELMYGENLAKGYYSAETAMAGWMNSPTHRANIMTGGFKTMGVTIYVGPDGNWYWAQEFGY